MLIESSATLDDLAMPDLRRCPFSQLLLREHFRVHGNVVFDIYPVRFLTVEHMVVDLALRCAGQRAAGNEHDLRERIRTAEHPAVAAGTVVAMVWTRFSERLATILLLAARAMTPCRGETAQIGYLGKAATIS